MTLMSNAFQTPKEDLNSKLGMDLKRAMLLRLARKDTELYPNDPIQREKVYEKYKVGQTCFSSLQWCLALLLKPVLEFPVFLFLFPTGWAAVWDSRRGSRVVGSESGGGCGETEAAGAQGNKSLLFKAFLY